MENSRTWKENNPELWEKEYNSTLRKFLISMLKHNLDDNMVYVCGRPRTYREIARSLVDMDEICDEIVYSAYKLEISINNEGS